MAQDKYSAVWLSHSSIGDYLKCPRLYYLRNVYKDPNTGHKITVMTPPLALGQAVHDVVQSLATLPTDMRLKEPLLKKLDVAWTKVSGEKGGFRSKETEQHYKDRARQMIQRIIDNPGPILQKAIPAKEDLPHYWLSEEDNIILCGKIDWLSYNEQDDSVTILDFKTGKHDEASDSLQLPIYNLLATNTQSRKVKGAAYWYLDRDNEPREVDLPNLKDSFDKVYTVAKRVALARKLDHFQCNSGAKGCKYCIPLEKVVSGNAKLVGISEYNQDIYIIDSGDN